MSISGYGPFQSDGAYMGLQHIIEYSDEPLAEIKECFEIIIHTIDDDYLFDDQGAQAIVAAELLAALAGRPHPALPDNARAWVDAQPKRFLGRDLRRPHHDHNGCRHAHRAARPFHRRRYE